MIFENVCMSIMSRPPLSFFPIKVFLFLFSSLLLQHESNKPSYNFKELREQSKGSINKR